jgi:hypothetical protein
MIVTYALVQPGAVAPTYDDALSGTAASLRGAIWQTWASGKSVVARRADEIVERLMVALREGAEQGSIYASPDALRCAVALMRAVPSDYPLPDVVVESDHEIGLDWGEGVRRVLSVSVGEGPMLRYAALIGAEPAHGRVAFTGILPETLSYFLHRIYGHHGR